jgi:hypothetical protein
MISVVQRGVPKDHLTFLMDDQANNAAVRKQWPKFVADAAADKDCDWIVAYWGSHGGFSPRSRTHIISCFDSSVEVDWIVETLIDGLTPPKRTDVRVMLFADACYSGGLPLAVRRYAADTRPGARPPFVQRRDPPPTAKRLLNPTAAVSSTFSQQTAWSGWRFVNCLRRAFCGDACVLMQRPTATGVTFDDLYRYTQSFMSHCADGFPMLSAVNGFNPSGLTIADVAAAPDTGVGAQGEGWHLPGRPVKFSVGEEVSVDDHKNAAKVVDVWANLYVARHCCSACSTPSASRLTADLVLCGARAVAWFITPILRCGTTNGSAQNVC